MQKKIANKDFSIKLTEDRIILISLEHCINHNFKCIYLSNSDENVFDAKLGRRLIRRTNAVHILNALLSPGALGPVPDLKFLNEQNFLPSVTLIALKAFQAIQTSFEEQAA